MAQTIQVRLSAAQRTDVYSRWKARQSLDEIGRAFGEDHVSVEFMLAQHGGIVFSGVGLRFVEENCYRHRCGHVCNFGHTELRLVLEAASEEWTEA